jgi:hypothetical protein
VKSTQASPRDDERCVVAGKQAAAVVAILFMVEDVLSTA